MGGDSGGRTVERPQGTRNELGRFGVDDYYREYYDLYGMDWEVIKDTRSRAFRSGIFWDRVGAFLFLALGAVLTLSAWSSRGFSFKDFGLFEWFMTVPLILGIGGFIQQWSHARWREAVIERYKSASWPPEPSLERVAVTKANNFE